MRKLYRSATDSKLTGLCGGFAEYFGIDATIVRIALVAGTLFSGGGVLLVYFLCSLVVPKPPVTGFYDPMHDFR